MKTLEALLKEQAARQKVNAKKKPHDNSKDYAGSMMVFRCTGCFGEIYMSEDYTPPRPTQCMACEEITYLQPKAHTGIR